MPQIGPAFLHRPLPALSSVSFDAARGWFAEGLGYFVPARLRRAFWRPAYRLVQLGDQDEDDQTMLIEEAWSGEKRIASVHGEAGLPLAVALPASRIFETTAELPAGARDRLRDAVALRLDSLSPVSPEEVVFDVGHPEKTSGGRLSVPIAIARKSDLQNIEERFNGESIHSFGALPRDDGSFEYIFGRSCKKVGATNRIVIAVAALFLGALLFAGGFAARLDKEIAASEAYEAELITALRHEKEIAGWLPEGEFARTGVTGVEMNEALSDLLSALPEGAHLKSAAYANGAWSLEGYAPENASWPDQPSPDLAPSDRPGFVEFKLTVTSAEAS